jgi:dipeptidyl aminopeptidase/acylaminoacyl peptidase
MATYSPNGAEIAYISPDGLAVAAADGSQARVLVPGALEEDFPLALLGLEWSPTGDRIAFVQASGESTDEGRTTELAVLAMVDVASGNVVSLAEMDGAYSIHSIKFSPEGDQILFTRDGDASSLWSVHADGSDLHRLVAGTGWGDWQTQIPTR